MGQDKSAGNGATRRTFLKTCGTAGLGIIALSFGVPTLPRAEPKPIKIGSIQPATDPLAVISQGQRRGNQMAVEFINARGGIKSLGGAKLELLLGDSKTNSEVCCFSDYFDKKSLIILD
ncbi:hypothetical protein DFAR_2150005 [Desulfarculales bacterium]